MNEFLIKFAKFFIDPAHPPGRKVIVFFVVVIGLFITEAQFGLSFYYAQSNKIKSVQEIEKIIHNPQMDTASKRYLLLMERDILRHKRINERFYDFFSGRNSSIMPQSEMNIATNPIDKTLYFLSYSILFLILICLAILATPFYPGLFFQQKITITVIMLVIFLLDMLVMSFISGLLPRIGESPWWNYLANFFIQSFLVWLTFQLRRLEKK